MELEGRPKPAVYIETTIPNFLIGEISPVLITAGHQAATKQWWNEKRRDYSLFTSALVELELAAGTSEYAAQRLALLGGVPHLSVNDEVRALARRFEAELRLPSAYGADAVHLALACHHRMDYLVTWNLKHIANAQVRRLVSRLHDEVGTGTPTICTPEELLVWGSEP
jgi:hypothetical protein